MWGRLFNLRADCQSVQWAGYQLLSTCRRLNNLPHKHVVHSRSLTAGTKRIRTSMTLVPVGPVFTKASSFSKKW
jgi:hypothetical protein